MRRFILALSLALSSSIGIFAQAPDRVQLINERDSLKAHLQIQAEDGKVAMADVFRAVSRYNGYDDKELADALPAGKIALQGRTAGWTISAINRVLRPCVHLRADGDVLDIVVDRQSARSWVNRRKSEVRWAWNKIDWRKELPNYGIEMIGELANRENQDIVVLIHGLNSRPADVAGFVPLIEQAGFVAATLRYPNDQPIDESSKLLARELREIASQYPSRNVRLVAHSMGGLVARGAVETDLDPGNVTQLIMVGTPNYGSSLARVATFMDCYEFCTSSHYRRTSVFVESVSDGLGEATADLAPNSVFLDRLNHLPRNPRIRYSILLGTKGPMEPEEMAEIRRIVRNCSHGNRYLRFASSKLNASLEDLDEVIRGQGDGVVSCRRGRLAGVQDIIELPFSHAGVLHPDSKSSQSAHTEILRRLRKGTN